MHHRRGIVFSVVLILFAVTLVAQSSERWLVFRSEHLLVGLRSDFPQNYLDANFALDQAIRKLQGAVDALEAHFNEVERLLRADYDVQSSGRVPVLIYPTLEAYQRASECLICAAHVGNPIWSPSVEDPILDFGAHLNLDSTTSTILHEFVHIVDFAAISNKAVPMWFEGLASYVGYRLQREEGQRILKNILPQFLKQYQQSHGLRLQDYLTRPNYGRWTYNLGANLIDFLVQRDGLKQFMDFYQALNQPELADYDTMFQAFYGVNLVELEREWQVQIDATLITEEGRLAYRFKFDQIVVRWVYLRPLLKHPERLNQAYLDLWEDGHFNVEAAQFMRDYLSDFDNMMSSPKIVEVLLQNAKQLRSYTATYADDTAIQEALFGQLAQLDTVCRSDAFHSCAEKYFQIVHTFVHWQ